MQAEIIKQLIEENLPAAEVQVQGDDGVHFQALVVSELFVGKSRIQQHRMVYDALGARLENQEIHALALKTYTPDAWAERETSQP